MNSQQRRSKTHKKDKDLASSCDEVGGSFDGQHMWCQVDKQAALFSSSSSKLHVF